jgi:hypothetical protein
MSPLAGTRYWLLAPGSGLQAARPLPPFPDAANVAAPVGTRHKARLALAGGPSTPRCLSRSTWQAWLGARTAPRSVYPVLARRPPAVYLSRRTRFSPIEPCPSPTAAAQAPRRAWNSLHRVTRLAMRDTGCAFQPFHHPQACIGRSARLC